MRHTDKFEGKKILRNKQIEDVHEIINPYSSRGLKSKFFF